jgi:hypothetical protein
MTSRYRKVGGTSNIDESLFGGENDKLSNSSRLNTSSSKNSNKIKNDFKSSLTPSIVISDSELQKIKVKNYNNMILILRKKIT